MSSTYKPVKINNLSFGYDKKTPILKDINLTIPRGGFSLITGPTGCGKSTLLKIIAGLYPEYGGKILSGAIENVPAKWSMIFQNPDRQFTMATPYEELVFTLENLNVDSSKAQDIIKTVSKTAAISNLLYQPIINLSGGEKQRVAFAVALAMKPDLLLLDEAFASCDQKNREFLQNQLAYFKQYGCTIIAVDHNLAGYQKLCDQAYIYQDKSFILASTTQMAHLFALPNNKELNFDLPKNTNLIFNSTNLTYAQEKTLVDSSKFFLPQNASVLLTGENGAGKSSLFKVLTQLLPYRGELTYQDKEVKKLKSKYYLRHVSQIFQSPDDQFLMVTVGEELTFSKKHNANKLLDTETLNTILEKWDLANRSSQVVYSLSGGQKKKLQVLLMVMANPDVLLLDEPFAGLDKTSIQEVSSFLKKYYLSQNKSMILISHQFDAIDELCRYHIHLANQQLTYLVH